MKTFDQWKKVVQGSTHNLTEDQINQAATLCVSTESENKPICAWHAAAVVCQTECHCNVCKPGIRYL